MDASRVANVGSFSSGQKHCLDFHRGRMCSSIGVNVVRLHGANYYYYSDPFQMDHETYRDLKARAPVAAKSTEGRAVFLKHLAEIIIDDLLALGVSQRGLLVWTGCDEFGAAQEEISQLEAKSQYQALLDQMWALARRTGAVTENRKGVRSALLTRALRLAAMTASKDFRMSFDRSKKDALMKEQERLPKAPKVIFYKPPIDAPPQTSGRWIN